MQECSSTPPHGEKENGKSRLATGEFRADLEVETQVLLLQASLHGLMVQWHRRPGSVDWHKAAQEIVRGLCALP